jgi:hypothetical protein
MENWLISLKVGRVKLLVGHGVLPPCWGYQERDLLVMGEAASPSQRAVCVVEPAKGLAAYPIHPDRPC